MADLLHHEMPISSMESDQPTKQESASDGLAILAPDFDYEWDAAPRSMKNYVEREVAEKWLMRGVWLGTQYERERGLVAMNGELKRTIRGVL